MGNVKDSMKDSVDTSVNTYNVKGNMTKDTLLYLPAKAIEGIIGIATLYLFTRFFKPEEYGDYNLAVATVNITALFLFGWLFQAAYRYVNNFSGKRKISVFYSTIFSVWTVISISTTVIGLILLLILRNRFDSYTVKFILFSILMFFTYSITQILFALLSAARIIKLNLILSILSAALKLALTTLYVKVLDAGIISTVVSIVLVDAGVIGIIVFRLKIYRYISRHLFSRKVMKKFIQYGIPLVGVSLSLSLLSHSDRYIIKFFLGSEEVGIYTANYSIASSVFSMLLLAIMRGVYPTILKTWKQNNISLTEELLSNAVRFFLIITVPAVVGISILSPVISRILDPLYISGSSVIIYVSIGMFFLGLTEYNNKAWELTSSTGVIFRNSLLCCLFNIISNIILIPVAGYKAAAVNTALSYIFYFLLSFFGSRKILKWHLSTTNYLRIFGSAALMGLIIYTTTKVLSVNIPMLIVLVPAGMVVYGAGLYLTGEIKPEVRQLVAKVKK
ncbi:MAG TPA: oligosaccharide flippase family protein [Clostridiales bacterium]|nr:oligosaccharide flippase family protein [Clostridiales bacterium]